MDANSISPRRLTIARRLTQLLTLAILFPAPVLGWIYLDLSHQKLVFFGNRVWLHEIPLLLFAIGTVFALLAGFSLFGGRLFCGWICPQTALSELATAFSRLLRLNKEEAGLRSARIALFLIVSLVPAVFGGLVIVNFFVPSGAVAGLFTGHPDTSLLKAWSLASLVLYVDVVLFRHTFCEWMCLVGWWQKVFVGKNAWRIAFQRERSKECDNCGECRTACFMGLEPRRQILSSSCVNCAKCVTACRVHLAPKEAKGLISFGFASPRSFENRSFPWRAVAFSILSLVIIGGFTVNLGTRSPVQVEIRQLKPIYVVADSGRLKGQFGVAVYNGGDSDITVDVSQQGLPEADAILASSNFLVPAGEKTEVSLGFNSSGETLTAGRHTLTVQVSYSDGTARRSLKAQTRFGVPLVVSEQNFDHQPRALQKQG